MTPTGYRHPHSPEARLDRLEKRLHALLEDLAAGVDPAIIPKRQAELAELLLELDTEPDAPPSVP